MRMKVLFVCLGNICRSPAAEGVFIHLINKKGLSEEFTVDSAGTSSFHIGNTADKRMIDHAKKRGINLPSRARQIDASDFVEFDWIVTMDDSNFNYCLNLAPNSKLKEKVLRMSDYAPLSGLEEVPDPYYGGPLGFESVLDMVTEGSEHLIKKFTS